MSRFSHLLSIAILSISWVSYGAEPVPPVRESLNGLWHADLSETQTLRIRIDESNIEASVDLGGQTTILWVGKLVISKDNPDQHMDWTEMKLGDRTFPNNLLLYRHRGDTLIVAGGGPERRPTRFFSGAGPEPKALVFTRDPKNKKPTEPPRPRQ